MLKESHARPKSDHTQCPVSAIVKIIGGKWKPAVLYFLMKEGPKRFNELQRLVGNPSARVLAAQLRELERDDIITRIVYDQVPPKVEYSMTEKGKSLSAVLDAMVTWSIQNNG